ncbi:MAG: J domain-containing protein [Chloroflexota bacterium]|nr:J domain-containing protein [Chloroflexota bacterium]
MQTKSPPDYYRILQVHPDAEQEIIEAAYRRLMRKYHPDMLDPNQRQDPEVQRKVQEINEAYEILGDAQKRTQYDDMLRNSKNKQVPFWQFTTTKPTTNRPVEVEKRMYPGRCTQTKQSFQILMARRIDSTGPFRVVGLSPLEESEQAKLITSNEQSGFFKRLFGKISNQRPTHNHQFTTNLPSDQELAQMFDESLILDFGDIDWAGFQCPFCEGVFTHPDGTLSTWTICGKCSRVSCAGGVKKTRVGGLTICPWCGSERQITYHVPAGKKAHKSVRGILSRQQIKNQPQKPVLPRAQDRKQLSSSKEKK